MDSSQEQSFRARCVRRLLALLFLSGRHSVDSGRRIRRSGRRLIPGAGCTLEGRTLLSSFALLHVGDAAIADRSTALVETEGNPPRAVPSTPDTSDAAGFDRRDGEFPLGTKTSNIPFPTVDGQSELLDVYTPNGPAPAGGWPVLVAIHGGGWRRFSKDKYGPRIASGFVPLGYVVVAPNYVLSAPGRPSWPVNFEDVEAAVRWVREQAQALDINPDRVAAIGESAGANLAALLGTTAANDTIGGVSSQVSAVVAFSTPTDLTALFDESHLGGLAAEQFLGGAPAKVPASYVDASPIDHVSPADAPMFLVQGLEDPLIPVSQSEAMAAALATAGVPHQLVLVNGGHALDFPEHYENLMPQILAFLNATWKD